MHNLLQVLQNTKTTVSTAGRGSARKIWEDRLNMDKAGMQKDAESFTKEFMGQMYGGGGAGEQQPQPPQQQQQEQLRQQHQQIEVRQNHHFENGAGVTADNNGSLQVTCK